MTCCPGDPQAVDGARSRVVTGGSRQGGSLSVWLLPGRFPSVSHCKVQ